MQFAEKLNQAKILYRHQCQIGLSDSGWKPYSQNRQS